MRPFILLILIAMLAAEEAPPDMPAAVVRAEQTFQREVNKAKLAYIDTFAKQQKAYLAVLQAEVTKATKAGNLPLANAVSAEQKKVEALLEVECATMGVLSQEEQMPTILYKGRLTIKEAQEAISQRQMITDEVWKKIPTKPVEIQAQGTEIGSVSSRTVLLMIPHPEDRWAQTQCTWEGDVAFPNYAGNTAPRRGLIWCVEDEVSNSLLIQPKKSGVLRLKMNVLSDHATNRGMIRVKFLVVGG